MEELLKDLETYGWEEPLLDDGTLSEEDRLLDFAENWRSLVQRIARAIQIDMLAAMQELGGDAFTRFVRMIDDENCRRVTKFIVEGRQFCPELRPLSPLSQPAIIARMESEDALWQELRVFLKNSLHRLDKELAWARRGWLVMMRSGDVYSKSTWTKSPNTSARIYARRRFN
jgi:hypothetical protein